MSLPATAGVPAETTDRWLRFRQDVVERGTRLVQELRATTRELQDIAARQLDEFAIAADMPLPEGPAIDAVAPLYRDHRPPLLSEPLAACLRERPLQRVLAAVEEYDRFLEQLIHLMPETVTCSGAEWAALFGADVVSRRARLGLRFRRTRQVPVRTVLLLGAREQRRTRRELEAGLLVSLAETSLALLVPWQAMRRAWFAPISGEWAGQGTAADMARLRADSARHAQQAGRALDAIEAWVAATPARLATYFAVSAGRADTRLRALMVRDDRRREFLGRQARAVSTDLDLDVRLSDVETSLLEAAAEARAAMEIEHRELLSELNAVVAWLDGWTASTGLPFPPAEVNILTGSIRLRTLAQNADAIAQRLPSSVEVTARLRVSGGDARRGP